MVGAHISSLLSFKFFVTVQSPISIFLPFRMALNRYNFSFSCSRFNRWTYYTKKRGVFLSFSGSLYIKKEMSFHISFLIRTFFCYWHRFFVIFVCSGTHLVYIRPAPGTFYWNKKNFHSRLPSQFCWSEVRNCVNTPWPAQCAARQYNSEATFALFS